jgi:adenylate cyclase
MKTINTVLIKFLSPLPIGIITAFLIWILASFNFLQLSDKSRNITLDIVSELFPYDQVFESYADNMLFIDIDDESLNQIGQWPWPRQTMADIFSKINSQNPLIVGVDILFAEKDRYSAKNMAQFYGFNEQRFIDLGILNGDTLLMEKMDQKPYVLAMAAIDDDQNISKNQAKLLSPTTVIGHANQYLYETESILAPIEDYAEVAGFGFVNTIKKEGKIRSTPLLFNIQGSVFPALNLDMIRVAQSSPNHILKMNEIGDKLQIKTGEIITETDLNGVFNFHYGDMNRFTKVSIKDLLEENSVNLADKIIILGSSAAGLGDFHSTSYQDDVPGPLIHLQVIDQILGKRFINFHPVYEQSMYFLTILFSILMCWAVTKFSVYLIIVLLPMSLLPLYIFTKYIFLGFGLIVNIPFAIGIIFTSTITTYVIKTFIENIEKKKIQSSFMQYVPESLVKNINKESDVPSLGGQEIQATIFFLDIRGYTTITENLKDQPDILVKVIGHIMNEVTNILIKHEATIDKYIGDAVMAFWNAPVAVNNYELKAMQASLEIKKSIPRIERQVKALLPVTKRKLISIDFGVGLCSGPVVVGNMGSDFRFNYSVMGDVVNVAARLESMTKEKKKTILFGMAKDDKNSINYYQKHHIKLVFIDNIAVRGKKEKIPVYAIE